MNVTAKIFYLPLMAALGLTISGIAIAGDQGKAAECGAKGFERMATELNLSQEQKEQFKKIHSEANPEMKKNRDAMKENHEAIRQLNPADNGYDQAVAKLADEQGKLVAASIRQHAKTRAQTDAILTPEQREKAHQLAQERRDRKSSKREQGPRF